MKRIVIIATLCMGEMVSGQIFAGRGGGANEFSLDVVVAKEESLFFK
jgi:hypothetical protein